MRSDCALVDLSWLGHQIAEVVRTSDTETLSRPPGSRQFASPAGKQHTLDSSRSRHAPGPGRASSIFTMIWLGDAIYGICGQGHRRIAVQKDSRTRVGSSHGYHLETYRSSISRSLFLIGCLGLHPSPLTTSNGIHQTGTDIRPFWLYSHVSCAYQLR